MTFARLAPMPPICQESTSGQPLVSVTMPVFNGERFLEKTVDSILAQSYPRIELVAVDDASSDRSVEILKTYRDPRIRIIEPGRHIGAVRAINIALEEARGELVARNDQDDISYPTRIEAQAAFLMAHPEVDLASCWMHCIGDDGSQLPVNYRAATEHDNALERMLLHGCPFGHSSVMYRKAAVMALGGYSEATAVAECPDYDLWLRMARAGHRFGGIAEFLADYRIHDAQMSRAKLSAARQVHRVRTKALGEWGQAVLAGRGMQAPRGLWHAIAGRSGSLGDEHARRSDWHRVLGKLPGAHRHAYAALLYAPLSGRSWRQAYRATLEKTLSDQQRRAWNWYLRRLADLLGSAKRRT